MGTTRKLLAAGLVTITLVACGGPTGLHDPKPTGLHDPKALARALTQQYAKQFAGTSWTAKDATCSEMDDGTFTCAITVGAATIPERTVGVHAQVSKDGQTAEFTEAEGQ